MIDPAPIAARSNAKPDPIAMPSRKLALTEFRDAKTSALATMAQFVTISGIKIPRERPSDGNQARKIISMQ